MDIERLRDIAENALRYVVAICVFLWPLTVWAGCAFFLPLHWGWAVLMISVQICWGLTVIDKALN
jgi:hypothetical protein